MTFEELQQAIDRFISQYEEGYWPPLANLARLTEELGELARAVNHEHGPKKRKPSENDSSVADELGDVVFSLAVLANSLGIDLGAAAQRSVDKVTRRDADRFVKKSSLP